MLEQIPGHDFQIMRDDVVKKSKTDMNHYGK